MIVAVREPYVVLMSLNVHDSLCFQVRSKTIKGKMLLRPRTVFAAKLLDVGVSVYFRSGTVEQTFSGLDEYTCLLFIHDEAFEYFMASRMTNLLRSFGTLSIT